MGSVTLDYAAPDEALREYISVFYLFRAGVPHFADDERADIAQFRFLLSGRGSYRFADGHVQSGPAIQLVGPTTAPSHVEIEGPIEVFGVGILPAGWGAMIGIDASALVNRVVDATELFGRELAEVAERLREAATLADKLAIGNALFRGLIARGHEQPRWFTRTVDRWLADNRNPDVDELVRATGLSRRQVERYCKRLYGAPPKLLARKYRALKAAVVLARGQATTADLLDHGFYDQSHCIREIKRFTGVTPTRITGDLPQLTRLTLRRTSFHGEVAPLVAET
jgi:AraC-like DNA-binding protein